VSRSVPFFICRAENVNQGDLSAWLLMSAVNTQGTSDLRWIIDLSKAMYLDYLHCGELNLPLFVPLYTCESIRERSNRERLDRRRAVSSRRFDVGIDFLFSVALVSFRFTSSLLTRKVRYG